jgi:xylulokinase
MAASNKGGGIVLFIGIDLGTSAAKLLLVDEVGRIHATVTKPYPVEYPKPGWSQQDPEDWWRAVREGVPELLADKDASEVRGIGCGGQMHGLVALDEKGEVIRPAILWNDGRSVRQVRYLNEIVGAGHVMELTGNIAYAGFTAPKLLWMRENEPELFSLIAHVMLPKDFVNFRLTGNVTTDPSDASGTLLLDVAHRCWSAEMLRICGLTREQLPKIRESFEAVGIVRDDVADELGLPHGVVVAAGAGDNAAAAIGTGVVGAGSMNISLGTSGTVFIPTASFAEGVGDRIHSFCHADGAWHLMGCILSAASCNKWWVTDILGEQDISASQAGIDPDRVDGGQPYFLPYLMGERTPHNDTYARGTFLGMRMDTTRQDMTRSVLEGVAFAIRDSVEIARGLGVDVDRSRVCGGGARSETWLRMLASVLGVTLERPETEQGPGYGGAILAAVASGAFPSVEQACSTLVRVGRVIEPCEAAVPAYDSRYQLWRSIYPQLKTTFQKIGESA